MKKIILISIFFFNLSFLIANPISSLSFEQRQSLLEKVKLAIEKEEAIAKAYELYLIKEYKKASSLSVLLTDDYLGRSFPKNFTGSDTSYFSNFVIATSNGNEYINYRLKSLITQNDTHIKSLYESDTFRKKTFFYDGKIYIILKTNLAKSIFALIKKQNQDLLDCTNSSSKQYCTKVDTTGKFKTHIYIYSSTSKTVANLLMYYLPENFEKGPILIKDDISVYNRDEFKLIPVGARLYDFKGEKYLKTFDDIRKVN